ncbi:unnamed protein product [Peronospora belbahrii]|uniref:RxLR effector PexRD54 WY domain-containing protein n=1 Tax=Peronospora belbahrii TaxID=622444 RepID=A0ABN8CT10_9STRA|nr:unnamed protein product [Peronospora belbahrii]
MRLLFATTCVGIMACQLNACAEATYDISADPFVDGPTRFLRAHELVHETKEENTIFSATLDANTSASNVSDCQEVIHKIKEERNIIAEAEAIASASSNMRAPLDQWLKEMHSTDKIFEILDLHNVFNNYFDHQNLKAWKLYVSKYKENNPSCDTTLYDTLIYYFGPYGFNKIMENLSMDSKLEPTPAQQKWLDEVKTPAELFTKLFVSEDKAIDDVLTDHSFIDWINYVKLFKNNNPSSHATIYEIVSTHFKPKRQYRFIADAEGTPVAATSVYYEPFLIENKTPYDVFVLMGLNEYGWTKSNLLTSPDFYFWTNYMKLYNEKYPQAQTTVYQTVRQAYNNLQTNMLLHAAMKSWLKAHISPADVLKYLDLDKVDLATISELYIDFLFTYRKKFFEQEKTKFADVLSHFMDFDVKLVDITYSAVLYPLTTKTRRNVLYGIKNFWLDEDVSPTSLFTLLGLNTDKGNLFDKPCFYLWLNYVDSYNAKHRGRKRKIDDNLIPATSEINLNSVPATPDPNSFPITTPLSILNSLTFTTENLASLYSNANSAKFKTLPVSFKLQFGRALNRLNFEKYKNIIIEVLPASVFSKLQTQRLTESTDKTKKQTPP